MKINAINGNYNRNNQNFRGLWGRTTQVTDFEKVLNVPKIQVVKYYFPFADETDEYIKDTIKKNSSAQVYTTGEPKYVVEKCKCCYTVPFTDEDYKEYKNFDGQSITPEIKRVHDFAYDKYLTNELGMEQVPAVNVLVRNKLGSK